MKILLSSPAIGRLRSEFFSVWLSELDSGVANGNKTSCLCMRNRSQKSLPYASNHWINEKEIKCKLICNKRKFLNPNLVLNYCCISYLTQACGMQQWFSTVVVFRTESKLMECNSDSKPLLYSILNPSMECEWISTAVVLQTKSKLQTYRIQQWLSTAVVFHTKSGLIEYNSASHPLLSCCIPCEIQA